MLKSHSERIANEILMYFRNIRKNSTDVYLGDSIEIDKDGNPLTIQETISDSKDLAEDLEKKKKRIRLILIICGAIVLILAIIYFSGVFYLSYGAKRT